eukprot:Partr_v1_DN23774_c0_g1_i1_m52733 putative retrotransposon Tto1 - Nicotiana tabacumSimilarity to retrotransposon Tto1 -Nicotiana tabacumSimilarity to reverse transcriptase pol - Volvox carteri
MTLVTLNVNRAELGNLEKARLRKRPRIARADLPNGFMLIYAAYWSPAKMATSISSCSRMIIRAMPICFFFKPNQMLRTDNGGEFKNASFTDYTLAYGILQEFTVPHCSCQNGVAERINLTILNAVRACLHESDLPLPFWDEAALCSMYTRNRSPTAANESM